MNVKDLIDKLTALSPNLDLEVVVAKRGLHAGGVFYSPMEFTLSVQPTAYTRSSRANFLVIGVEDALQRPQGLLPDNGDQDSGD